jgi:hypothetical protein
MTELPKVEGNDWYSLTSQPRPYAIEGEGRKEFCSYEQALQKARKKADEINKPVRVAAL